MIWGQKKRSPDFSKKVEKRLLLRPMLWYGIVCVVMCWDVMGVHLYDLLNVLDLVHELHLCHPPDVLELPDRPDHTQQKQKQQKQHRERRQ